ncbi:MAG TPA: hypothetical protein VFY60_18550 [Pyrinomonadaceae bacterium]|nr:hypothetical protein [Pyrinomonadaceae bacterium]
MLDERLALLAKNAHVNPFQQVRKGDPTVRFCNSIRGAAISLETRTDDQLQNDARNNSDPVLREHAIYQIIARQGIKALPLIEAVLNEDTDSQVRINTLWALEGLDDERCKTIALPLVNDADARVQEWARVFCWEMGWSPEDFRRAKEARYYEGRTFDETIFLHIKCDLFIRLAESNDLWGHVIMSPQMLARVYGQALACPIMKTREKEIVISKTLKGLHADGTNHYEAFLFKGFTERTQQNSGNFYFETQTTRPFYLSGKADDVSEGVINNVVIPFGREGQWFLNPNVQIDGKNAIEYVRGLFQGWAYVNLNRIVGDSGDFMFPGNSVLSTLHHPEVGPLTNTFLFGGFKGKVVDWDNDGVLDLNYLPSYATAKGEIDSDLDGKPDIPGMMVCPRPFQN